MIKKIVFLFIASLTLLSCSNDSNDNVIYPTPVTTNDVAFFKAKLDTENFYYVQSDVLNPTHYHSFGNGFNGNGSDKSYYYSGYMIPNNGFLFYPSIDLTFHNMFVSTSDTEETNAFYGLFDNLPSNFISYDDDNINWSEGVSLTYVDENENYYSTLGGSQNGSSITFSSKTEGYDGNSNLQTVTLTGNVNCKLYREDDPNIIKTITQGSFKLIFREYN